MSQENDIEQSMTAGDVGGVLADQSDVLLDTDGGGNTFAKPTTNSGRNANPATH